MSGKRKFNIDTDAGLDDAQAICMALGANDVDVVAITTVQGNLNVSQIARNVIRVLKLANGLGLSSAAGF